MSHQEGMTMSSVRTVAAIAFALGLVLVFSVVTLLLFVTRGAPFGALNDWSIGLGGVSAVALVLSISAGGLRGSWVGRPIVNGLGVLGGLLVVAGAWLVVSDTTGFLLAGLVESSGFGLFGIWLIAFNRSLAASERWPSPLTTLGLATGVVLAVGLIVAPAIAMGLDDADRAPWWVWVGFLGWLGIFALLPIWSIRLGIILRRSATVIR
jgi:hypothetical protein